MRRMLLWLFVGIFSATTHARADLIGNWDAFLQCPGGKIRFEIQFRTSTTGDIEASVVNGIEKIAIPTVNNRNGSVYLGFDHFDSEIVADFANGRMSGQWTKRRGENQNVVLEFGAERRDTTGKSTVTSDNSPFAGRWSVDFEKSNDAAVGIFTVPSPGQLAGTFLTTTGDYRYLFGRSHGNEMQLSCFDGSHAFLFTAQIETGKISGDFWSANAWHEKWTAVADPKAKLADAFAQTSWSEDTNLADYSFPNLDGESIKLNDPEFKADAKLIYIFGSWCPNCHDAAPFFKQLKEKFGDRLKIVGIAFEHNGDFEQNARQIRRYLARHQIDYPILIGGQSDKKEASRSVPFLDKVRSYPTTIFVDADENIRAVHTGFTGPATGAAYQKMRQRFEDWIERIANF